LGYHLHIRILCRVVIFYEITGSRRWRFLRFISMYHQLPVLALANHPIYLISGIRTYRENPISMIICIKRRHRKFGY